MKRSSLVPDAIMGGADGLGIVLGLLAGLIVSHQSAHAVWVAALSGGVAEFLAMANGRRLSDSSSGWLPPLVIGAASLAACVVPAVPYALSSGPLALALALALACAVAAGISWLRPERGVLAVAETYGLMAIVAVACGLLGLVT